MLSCLLCLSACIEESSWYAILFYPNHALHVHQASAAPSIAAILPF